MIIRMFSIFTLQMLGFIFDADGLTWLDIFDLSLKKVLRAHFTEIQSLIIRFTFADHRQYHVQRSGHVECSRRVP